MDSKTPVSLLQELLMKRGWVPAYKLLHSQVNPQFTYQVSALERSAEGNGTSKQQAKEAAAWNLLQSLNLLGGSDERTEEVVQSPYAGVEENSVDALQEFCVSHKFSHPFYEMTCEGPPQAKLFGMKCTVIAKLSTTAEAHAKKQAKQNAARLMLQKLKKHVEDRPLEFPVVQTHSGEENANQVVTEKLNELDLEDRDTQNLLPRKPLGSYDQLCKTDVYTEAEKLELSHIRRKSF